MEGFGSPTLMDNPWISTKEFLPVPGRLIEIKKEGKISTTSKLESPLITHWRYKTKSK